MKTNQNLQRREKQEMLSKVYVTIGQRWLNNERTAYMPIAQALKSLNTTLGELYSDIQIDCTEDKTYERTANDICAYKAFFKLVVKTKQCKKAELKRFTAAAFCAIKILQDFEIKELR